MSEANRLTNKILGYLYSVDVYAFRINITGIPNSGRGMRTAAKKGICDLLAIDRGRFIGIEIKIGEDRLSQEQIGFIKNVEHFGGKCFVAKTFNQFLGEWNGYKAHN